MYKSTELIMKEFDGKVKYIVAHTDSFECIVVGLALPGYPVRQLHYYCDEGNGVVVRLPELLNNVSNENYVAVLQECNALTLDTGCLKFGINDNMSVIAGYEFPEFTPDEGVGPMAFEIFLRVVKGFREFHDRLDNAAKVHTDQEKGPITFDEIEEMKSMNRRREKDDNNESA